MIFRADMEDLLTEIAADLGCPVESGAILSRIAELTRARNDVIEECAKVAVHYGTAFSHRIPGAIRALAALNIQQRASE